MAHPGHSHTWEWRLGPKPETEEDYKLRMSQMLDAIERELLKQMGNWNINIQGVGAHHNPDYPKDANKMAAEFVKQLKEAGHTVEVATFTHGGKETLDK